MLPDLSRPGILELCRVCISWSVQHRQVHRADNMIEKGQEI